MTILVKKVFISSKPTFVCLLCPPLCGPFSIQESAAGGLSYKVKNPAHSPDIIRNLYAGSKSSDEMRFTAHPSHIRPHYRHGRRYVPDCSGYLRTQRRQTGCTRSWKDARCACRASPPREYPHGLPAC